MKKSITLFALSSLFSCYAFASAVKAKSKENTSTPTTVSLATYEKVARENETLKATIWNLTEETAELKSRLSYETMMGNMFLSIRNAEADDRVADMQAAADYNEMMAGMFSKISQQKQNEASEDASAIKAYESMMKNMFLKMNATPLH